ncbi:MAG TPA: DUF2490 domain-containing protein [Qipengyuania sp.]|nr:DUF2490 domain-containing protein [Qipengyuania sp.]
MSAHATPALAETDLQQWLSVSAKAETNDSLAVQSEVVARFGDDTGGLYELEGTLLLGYKLSDQVTAWAGYVHNPTYRDGDFVVMEHRAREQLTVDNFAKLGGASLSARLRFEQRWREGVDGTGWRMRPYIKVAVPLGDKSAPAVNFTAEPFINLNTTSFQSSSGLDRLRSAVSLSVPVAKAVKLEAGYLNQHRFVRGGEDRGEHAVTAALSLSF